VKSYFSLNRKLIYFIVLATIGSCCLGELNAQTEPRLVLPVGHTSKINCVSFSPDGKRIVTASNDNTAKIWDVSSGKLLQSMEGHTDYVEDAQFSPDGERIVSAGRDNTVRIWDARSGQLIHELSGYPDWVLNAKFSPDGEKIVTVSLQDGDNTYIWDATTRKILRKLTGRVLSASFSPDGRIIVTVSQDMTARFLDASTGECLQKLSLAGGVGAGLSSDGNTIVTAGRDDTARIWDVKTGKLMQKFSAKLDYNINLDFRLAGNKFVTVGKDNNALIWDVSTGKLLHTLTGHSESVFVASFSPDGRNVVTASRDMTARVWDASTGECLRQLSLSGNTKWINGEALSADGKTIVTLTWDTAKVWDLTSGQLLHNLEGPTGDVWKVKFSSEGNSIIMLNTDGTALIWDASTGKSILKLNYIENLVLSADRKMIFNHHGSNTANIYDASNGKYIKRFEIIGHTQRVNNFGFSPNGSKIVTASNDSTVRIWDAVSGELMQILKEHTDYIRDAQFSPDGKKIVTASGDNTARVWDASTGECLQVLSGHDFPVDEAIFSSDGKVILTISGFFETRLWNVSTGELLPKLEGEGNQQLFSTPIFSPNGKRIVAACRGNKAHIWDVSSGKILNSLTGHSNRVQTATYSPDGKTIITTGADRKTIIWDAATGKPLYTRLQLTGNDWLVYDEDYRFDGTEGAINYLYFACGLEVVELAQLKDSLWVPGLAEKIMKGEKILINDKTAPKLKNLNICEFTPVIETPMQDGKKLRYRIVPRRGGLGNTEVIINGNPTYSYAPNQLERKTEEGKEVFYLNLNTDTLQDYLTASSGAANPLQVKAAVKGSGIYGRGQPFELFKSTGAGERPKFYGVFVGVNDYGNPQGTNNANRYRDLTFAQKDASDMADAVEACARNLFDKDSCFIYRLTGKDNVAPTKDNLQWVLGEIGKKARASDVLYIFFAGHGDLLETDGSKQIRFLLQNAEKRNVKSGSFGTEDLTDWCHPRKIKAQKRVFVFDACHSGQLLNETYAAVQGRGDDEGNRIRQLDKLKDQNGMMILAASAENESAYEDETLNQGVLTYHLLQAMKTQAKDTSLTVRNWFDETIDLVKDYGRQNGQQQEPSSFGDGYFYIGNVNKAVRDSIDIACPKIRVGSAVLRATNPTSKQFYPYMQDKLNAALVSAESSRGSMVYSKQTDKAYRIIGDYKLVKGKLEINYDVYFGDAPQKTYIALKARKYKSEDEAVQALLQSVTNEVAQLGAEWRKKNCKMSRQ
jgi:WD40 repeat protein